MYNEFLCSTTKINEKSVSYYFKTSDKNKKRLVIFFCSYNGSSKVFFKYINNLECDIIALNYDLFVNSYTFIDDLYEIIKTKNYEEYIAFGYSFGGILLELFAKKYPKVFNKIIFLNTQIITDKFNKKEKEEIIKSYKRFLRSVNFFTKKKIHKTFFNRVKTDILAFVKEDKDFYIALYDEILSNQKKRYMKNIYISLIDYYENMVLYKSDFNDLSAEIFVLVSESLSKDDNYILMNEVFEKLNFLVLKSASSMVLINEYDTIFDIIRE